MKDKLQHATTKQPPRKRGAGSIFLRGDIWWIRFSRRGKQHRESSHSSDPQQALKLLDRRTKQLWAEKQGLASFVPRAERVFVDKLLDSLEKEYIFNGGRALPQFQSHVRSIREAFGDMRAVDVTTVKIDKYIERRLEDDKKKPATINHETRMLGAAFSLAIKNNQIVTKPHIRKLP